MTVTFSDIEDGILDLLDSKILKDGEGKTIKRFDVRRGASGALATPAVGVAVEGVTYRRSTDLVLEVKITLGLYLLFKNLAGENARRKGVYPMLEGAVQILAFQDLDLEIEPLLPTASDEILDDELTSRGMIGFKTTFVTSYDIEIMTDSDAGVALLEEGINYFIKPKDTAAGMKDDIFYPTE